MPAAGEISLVGLEEATNDLALQLAASRRKGSRPSGRWKQKQKKRDVWRITNYPVENKGCRGQTLFFFCTLPTTVRFEPNSCEASHWIGPLYTRAQNPPRNVKFWSLQGVLTSGIFFLSNHTEIRNFDWGNDQSGSWVRLWQFVAATLTVVHTEDSPTSQWKAPH